MKKDIKMYKQRDEKEVIKMIIWNEQQKNFGRNSTKSFFLNPLFLPPFYPFLFPPIKTNNRNAFNISKKKE